MNEEDAECDRSTPYRRRGPPNLLQEEEVVDSGVDMCVGPNDAHFNYDHNQCEMVGYCSRT